MWIAECGFRVWDWLPKPSITRLEAFRDTFLVRLVFGSSRLSFAAYKRFLRVFGMRIGDSGGVRRPIVARLEARGATFLVRLVYQVVSGYFRGLYAICGDCGSAIAECGL